MVVLWHLKTGTKAYLSGPMRGYPDSNRAAFYEAAEFMRMVGLQVWNPVDHFIEGEGDHTPVKEYVLRDLKALVEQDVLVQLPGWQDSKGALAEWLVARWLDMPAYEYSTGMLTHPYTPTPATQDDVTADAQWVHEMEGTVCLGCGCPNGPPRFPTAGLHTPNLQARHPASQRLHDLLHEIGELHDRKQKDYGTDRDPFANVRASAEFGVPAWIGALVRLNDKVVRLKQFAKRGTLANESARDSMLDIAVYALIACVLYEEVPEEKL